MKTVITLFFLGVCINTFAQKIEKLWETDTVFSVPESVLFDDTVLYVSNVNGKPSEQNQLGFISKINSSGDILELNWVGGLNAPKGMGVFNGVLYVSDINRVAIIDRVKGELFEFVEIPGSEFLNDISVSANGMVAVSDMNKQTIHLIKDKKLIKSITNDKFQHVNGLFWDNGFLLAGTDGFIYKIDVDSENIETLISGTGGIDGLEKVDANTYVISDWSGKIQLVSTNAAPVELLNTSSQGINAADLGFDKKTKTLFVPTFFHNTVSAYKLIK